MKIGVLGANGVAATNRLCELIERKLTIAGAFRDAHHPDMVIVQATQVPSRSMFLEGKGPDWRPAYIRIAKELKQLGCDVGCMCCNTAHYAIDDVVKGSGLPFINILKEVAKRIERIGLKKIELWASDGARKFDIYGAVFRRMAPSCTIIYPTEERQKLVTEIICAVKTNARFLPIENSASPRFLIRKLLDSTKIPVVLGCTDIRISYRVDESLDKGICLDSLEVLADAVVDYYRR